jgi:hypothetical protein
MISHQDLMPRHALQSNLHSAHSPPAMPPRRKRKAGSKGNQSRHSINLLDLPLPALALIYQHCDDAARKALLCVSAGCQEWVLREARSIKLVLPSTSTTATRKPLARLLNRACNASACSLTLCLDIRHVGDQQDSGLVADLLQPGIQQSGWASVAKLVLQVRSTVQLSC